MKHIITIISLVVAAAAVFITINHGRILKHLPTAVVPASAEKVVVPTQPRMTSQTNAPPMVAQSLGVTNSIPATNSMTEISSPTNSWESSAAARYGDLINQIRAARGK